MPFRRSLLPASALLISGLVLAGCASGDAETDEASSFRIVTSTSVYADIVADIVGDSADVEAVIDSAAVDPHDYEATARDSLTVSDADLVIMNGGGYDHFMDDLLETADVEHVMSVVEYSHAYPGEDGEEHSHDHADEHDHGNEGDGHDHAEADEHDHVQGFNEHVWYDPHTIEHFAEAVQEELDELLPDASEQVVAGTQEVLDQVAELEGRLDEIATDHDGETAFFTEPVGAYFAEAAGLTDATVEGFAEAVEHGEDVAPAVLNAAVKSIESGEVSVLVANAQTGGSETDRVIEAAESSDVPVIEFTETIPDGETFFAWMNANADALSDALG